MELTNHQIYALFGIAAAVALFGFIIYRIGLQTGLRAAKDALAFAGITPNPDEGPFAEDPQLIAALRALDYRDREINTLRRNIQTEADDHAKVERGLLQRLAAAAPLNDEDEATLQAIAGKLELAAETWQAFPTGGDHARYARQLAQHALNMAQRLRTAATNALPHPDSELIDWLEEEATVDFDLETATLRFFCPPGSEIGVTSTRALLRQAKADSMEMDRNHSASLEAVA